MRKPIIAGNWKMNKSRDEALDFIYEIAEKVPSNEVVDSVICSQPLYLDSLVKRQGDNLRIGAQNMHYEEKGAFTGEISPKLLQNSHISYVIIGHSERRQYYNENDIEVNKKLHSAFNYSIKPILCVGETLEQRDKNETNDILKSQVTNALKGLSNDQIENLTIAYEPIWAIGTGKTATSEIANEACKYIREVVTSLYSNKVSSKLRIQYGGSVKPSNIKELMSMSDIDGALVGGASLEAESFLALINNILE